MMLCKRQDSQVLVVSQGQGTLLYKTDLHLLLILMHHDTQHPVKKDNKVQTGTQHQQVSLLSLFNFEA